MRCWKRSARPAAKADLAAPPVADDGRRFLRALVLMQAVTVPLLVALLLLLLPPEPTLQLSLLLRPVPGRFRVAQASTPSKSG